MKIVSIDLETTGLTPDEGQTIEFGAVLDDLSNPQPIEYLPTFHCYIKRDSYFGGAFPLSMHPTIFRRIADNDGSYQMCGPGNVETRFASWLEDHGYERDRRGKIHIIPAGKNFGSFDRQFIDRDLGFGNTIRMAHRAVDPAILYLDLSTDDRLPDSETCLERAGLDTEVAHTAVEDAMMVVKLLRWHYGFPIE